METNIPAEIPRRRIYVWTTSDEAQGWSIPWRRERYTRSWSSGEDPLRKEEIGYYGEERSDNSQEVRDGRYLVLEFAPEGQQGSSGGMCRHALHRIRIMFPRFCVARFIYSALLLRRRIPRGLSLWRSKKGLLSPFFASFHPPLTFSVFSFPSAITFCFPFPFLSHFLHCFILSLFFYSLNIYK
jgi:hypothetical protein